MLQVCIVAAAGLFAALVIRKDKPEYAAIIMIMTCLLIAMRFFGVLQGIVEEIDSWSQLLEGNIVYVKLLLKLIGITYVCEFAAGLCKDSGYTTLSNHIELFGKITIIAVGMPIVQTLLEMIQELLS